MNMPQLRRSDSPRYTTGHSCFAESCHSVNPKKHSANSLPSVTLGNEVLVNCTSTTTSLPNVFYRTFVKDLADCHLVLGKEKSSSQCQVTVTELLASVLSDTRQRLPLC
jgi:hypothetical protein